jgi:hypothetical protein
MSRKEPPKLTPDAGGRRQSRSRPPPTEKGEKRNWERGLLWRAWSRIGLKWCGPLSAV